MMAFIDFCYEQYLNSDDEIYKDTMLFALADMHNFNAVKVVLQANEIDYQFKRTLINKNYETIAAVLENDPTIDDVEIVIIAMGIRPINEIAPLLKRNRMILSEDKRNELDDIIKYIENNGENANNKYIAE